MTIKNILIQLKSIWKQYQESVYINFNKTWKILILGLKIFLKFFHYKAFVDKIVSSRDTRPRKRIHKKSEVENSTGNFNIALYCALRNQTHKYSEQFGDEQRGGRLQGGWDNGVKG